MFISLAKPRAKTCRSGANRTSIERNSPARCACDRMRVFCKAREQFPGSNLRFMSSGFKSLPLRSQLKHKEKISKNFVIGPFPNMLRFYPHFRLVTWHFFFYFQASFITSGMLWNIFHMRLWGYLFGYSSFIPSTWYIRPHFLTGTRPIIPGLVP